MVADRMAAAVAPGLPCLLPGDDRADEPHDRPPLLPIVLVYHVTHYYTLVQTQGVKVIALVSDPFGFGWNLFGTATWLRGSIIPDMNIVWHTQVGLLLAGHIASVVVVHLEVRRLD